MHKRLAAAALCALAASCVPSPPQWVPPAPEPAPSPTPTPTPLPTPTPALPPARSVDNWMDMPRTQGDWFYRAIPPYSYAAYGESERNFLFTFRCDKANRTVSLGRVSAQKSPQPMRIRAESAERLLTAQPRQGSIETLLGVDLDANDPLLDAMAISKGRFSVEVGGERTIYLPSWPEVTRVIEDCR